MDRKQAETYVEIMAPSMWNARGHMTEKTKKAVATFLASVPDGILADIAFSNGSGRNEESDYDKGNRPVYDYDAALKMVKAIGDDGLHRLEIARCVESDIEGIIAYSGRKKLADDCYAVFFRLCDSIEMANKNFDEDESDEPHDACDLSYVMISDLISTGKVKPSEMDGAAILNCYY